MFDDSTILTVNHNDVLSVNHQSTPSHPTVTPKSKDISMPATQTDVAAYFDVSKQSVGKWLGKIEKVLDAYGLPTNTLKDSEKRVTAYGFEQIEKYKELGISGYRDYVTSQAENFNCDFEDKTDKVEKTALTLFDSTSIALHDSDIASIGTRQSNKLTTLSETCDTQIDATLAQFMGDNSEFFSNYLQSGIQIGEALGKKKALLTVQAMQNAESSTMNALLKKQSEALG